MRAEKEKSKPKEETNSNNRNDRKPAGQLSGHRRNFDNGVQPHSFTGVISVDGQICATVRFKDAADEELIPISDLKTKWPQMLIHFLEKRLVYQPDDSNDMNGHDDGDDRSSDDSEEPDEPDEPDSPVAGPSGVKRNISEMNGHDSDSSDD
jgi:hypothetical protein